jgi:hypothetical protein
MSPVILAISDATGETAEQSGKAALAQFGSVEHGAVRVLPNVLDLRALEEAVLEAKRTGALLVYTLVGPELRENIKDLAQAHRVVAIDLLGPLIRRLATHLGRDPYSVPGLGHELSEEYFRRIEAVEFAVSHDDGKRPRNLPDAEIVLVGISRTSKTPLSNHIAQRGYKVANVPIVLDVPLPREMDLVDPKRVFALTIDPPVLMRIRETRMENLRMPPDSNYGDLAHIRSEIEYANRIIAEHPDWTVIDMSRKAVEEAASTVVEKYCEHFVTGPGALARAADRDA